MLLLWIVVLIVGVAWLAHRRVAPHTPWAWALYLVAMAIFSHAPGWLLDLLVLLACRPRCCCLICGARCSPLFNWFQNLPPVS